MLDESQWQGELTATYVLFHSRKALLQVDGYVIGGVGMLSSRPIVVIDPDHRAFDWKVNPSFGGGGGLRVLIGRWFAATVEVRDFSYIGRHEALTIAPVATDPSTWYGPFTLIDNMQLLVGLSIFVPAPR